MAEPAQADIINTATAQGTYLGLPVSSAPVTVNVPVASPTPAIGIVKTGTFNDVNGNGFADVNDTITYTFVVKNLGSVTLTNVAATDNKIGAVACVLTTLAPGQSTTCTGPVYHLSQADVDAGSVSNQATVTAKAPDGSTVTDLSDPTTPGVGHDTPTVVALPGTAAIGLIKPVATLNDTNSNGQADAGETLGYTFTVKNLGGKTLTAVSVTDPKVSGITCAATTLAQSQATTCSGTPYVITQADLDAGKVTNQATVTSKAPDGSVISDLSDPTTAGAANNAPTVTPLTQKSIIGLVKTAGPVVDVNSNGVTDVGDTITYSFAVSNLGNVSLSNVALADPMLASISCPKTTLAPAEVMNCTAPAYVLKQSDIDAGKVTNQATATASKPSGGTVSDLSDPLISGPSANSPTVVTLNQNAIIGLVKTAAAPFDANSNGVLDAGDTIAYSFKVSNLGSVTLNAITVTDSIVANITCPPGNLAPGASVTCSGNNYVITQANMDAGQVSNSATVTSKSPKGTTVSDVSDPVTAGPSANAPTVTPLGGNASMTVAKIDTLSGGAVVGTPITYKFTIKNTGTVSLHNITLSDAGATVSGGPIVTLAPGVSDTTTFTASHPLTASDIAAGSYTNTATATATPSPVGSANITANGSATTTLNTNAAMTFTKSGVPANGPAVPPKAGDKVNYTLVVTNTGATPLFNVSVSDPLLASAETSTQQMVALLDLAGNPDAANFATASFDHAGSTSGIVAADNRRAHLRDAGGLALADTLSISRQLVRMSGATGDLQAGEKIGVLYSITNSGKEGVSDISVTQTDSLTFGGHVSLLGGGETDASSMIFTRELTPDDIASGGVVSNGYVSSTQQGHDALQAVTDVLPLSGIKTYDDIATASISPASDPQLNAGLSYTFTAPYTLTQADIDAGTVHNLATATAKDGGGASLIKTASFDLPLQQAPLFGAVKTGTITPANGVSAQVGDVIVYKFAVTNLGNVTLKNVGITDGLINVSGGPIASLAPGVTDNSTITAQYTLTQTDIDAGKYQNQATVTASVQGGGSSSVLSDNADPKLHRPTVTPIVPAPAIGLLKQVTTLVDTNLNGINDAGDVIHYQFTVYNLGNVTLHNINVTDKVGGGANVTITGGPIVSLAPGQTSTQITGSYPITQTDVDAGHVNNTATATGTAPDGTIVTHDSDPLVPTQSNPTIEPLVQQPQIVLYKKLASWVDTNNDGILNAGDVLHYTFTVVNSGNVTLSNLQLTDALASAQVQNLAPGATMAPGVTNANIFTATYTVTTADETAGVVKNRATIAASQPINPAQVNATSLNGDPTSSTNSTTDTTIHPTPSISILLVAPTYADTNGDGIMDVGDTLTYQVKIKNTGLDPLNNITVQDYVTGITIAGTLNSTLLPNQEDTTSFIATHVLTANDIASGIYKAQAKAIAADATASAGNGQALQVTKLSDPLDYTQQNPTVFLIVANPSITALKTFNHFENASGATIPAPATGAFAVYTITVTNTGNVPFDTVTVAESGIYTGNVSGATPFTLAAGASDSTHFAVKHQITNAEMLAGHVDNQILATGTNIAKNLVVTDLSDPSNPATHNVTIVPLTVSPAMAVVKNFTVADTNGNGIADAGDTIKYTFTVANTGNIDLTNITITDTGAVLPAIVPVLPSLAVGASDTITFTATHLVTPADAIADSYSNQAKFTSTELPLGVLSDKSSLAAPIPQPTVTQLYVTKPVLTKVAARSQVKRGDVVPFTITASNLNGGTYQLADIMPPGFVFVAGSAQVNGVVKVPVLNGMTLTFNNLTPTNGKIILTLNLTAQASLSGGQFVNNARLIDQTSNAVLAVAQATVEVIPEATFDCSDIIGRVFDDVSGDGYMRDGYKGLGGVRLATANGTLVITDAEGRFHIPCAAIPDGAIGSNFIMKIDPRTLPQGYKITTENPRVVRVTRGKMTEINFGATKIHEVKVDITGRAFDNGSADLTEKWSLGIDRLVDILRKRRSDLQIVYHQGSESGELAQARVDAVAGLVKEAFASAKGGYALDINASVEPNK